MEIEVIEEIKVERIQDPEDFSKAFGINEFTAEEYMEAEEYINNIEYLLEKSTFNEIIIKKIIQIDRLIQYKFSVRESDNLYNEMYLPVLTTDSKSYSITFENDTKCLKDNRLTIIPKSVIAKVKGLQFIGVCPQRHTYALMDQYLMGVDLIITPFKCGVEQNSDLDYVNFWNQKFIKTQSITSIHKLISLYYIDAAWKYYIYSAHFQRRLQNTEFVHNNGVEIIYKQPQPLNYTKEQRQFLENYSKIKPTLNSFNLTIKQYILFKTNNHNLMTSYVDELSKIDQHIKDFEDQKKQIIIEHTTLQRWLDTAKKIKIPIEAVSLGQLKKKLQLDQINTIQQMIENEDNYFKSIVNNKCPHVKLERRLLKTINVYKQKEILEEFKKFIKKPTTTEFIICNNCGFNLVCPHIIAKISNADKPYHVFKQDMTKFIGGYLGNAMTCKICFEDLEIERFEEVLQYHETYRGDDDPLKQVVWKEVMKAFSYVTISGLIDIKPLISKISNGIYPLIKDAQMKELKNKTKTMEDVDNFIELYAAIFAFASIIAVMSKNNNIELKGVNKPNTIARLSRASYIISSSKNIILQSVKLTSEKIASLLASAYKALENESFSYTEQHTNIYVEKIRRLVHSSIYRYLYNRYNIDAKKIPIGEINEVKLMDKVIGGDINKVTKYQVSKLKNNDIVNDSLIDIFMGVPLSDEACKKLAEMDEREELKAHLLRNRKFFKLPIDRTRQFHRVKIPLSYIYDDKGYEHRWNLFSVGKKIMNLSEFIKLQDDGKHPKIEDVKCIVCGWMWSELDKKNDLDILKGLNKKESFENFKLFYEVRCPEGGSHEFVGGVCKKCNLFDLDVAYYNKYKSTYKSDLDELRPQLSTPIYECKKIKLDLKSNKNVFNEFAKNQKIDKHEFSMLGFMQYTNYDDISKVSEPVSMQKIYVIFAQLRDFIVKYSMIRNAASYVILPEFIKKILKVVKINPVNVKLKPITINIEQETYVVYSTDVEKAYDYVVELFIAELNKCNAQGALGQLIVKTFIDDMFLDNKRLSKPGYKTWKLKKDVIDDNFKAAEINEENTLEYDLAGVSDLDIDAGIDLEENNILVEGDGL